MCKKGKGKGKERMKEAQIKNQEGTLSDFGENKNTPQTLRWRSMQDTWKKKPKPQSY